LLLRLSALRFRNGNPAWCADRIDINGFWHHAFPDTREAQRFLLQAPPGFDNDSAEPGGSMLLRRPVTASERQIMSPLRIYGIARTRAFRALWMAKELGLDDEHLPIEIGDAGARAPEFLKLNPNGRLPFIEDNGFVLFESLAITLYLAKKHASGTLYPGTLEGEARAWQWSFWAIAEVDRGVNIWSLHAVRLPEAERDAGKRDEALKVLVAPFKVLDAAVAQQLYLLGNDFTVADLNVAAVISRAIDMDLSAAPNLKAWLTRCLERPAARAALALKAKADSETPAEVTRRIAKINRL
jgi:glutathione S-transferase